MPSRISWLVLCCVQACTHFSSYMCNIVNTMCNTCIQHFAVWVSQGKHISNFSLVQVLLYCWWMYVGMVNLFPCTCICTQVCSDHTHAWQYKLVALAYTNLTTTRCILALSFWQLHCKALYVATWYDMYYFILLKNSDMFHKSGVAGFTPSGQVFPLDCLS